MKKDILNYFLIECETCQRNKGEKIKSLGALQPFPIPTTICKDIPMDYIVGLMKAGNKSIIMVVFDPISKYVHFGAFQHFFTLANVVKNILDHIFKLHGIPTTIVFGKDPTFTNNFWK